MLALRNTAAVIPILGEQWAGRPLQSIQSVDYNQVPFPQDIGCCNPRINAAISSKLLFTQKCPGFVLPLTDKLHPSPSLGATMRLGHEKNFELSPHIGLPPSSPFP